MVADGVQFADRGDLSSQPGDNSTNSVNCRCSLLFCLPEPQLHLERNEGGVTRFRRILPIFNDASLQQAIFGRPTADIAKVLNKSKKGERPRAAVYQFERVPKTQQLAESLLVGHHQENSPERCESSCASL